MSLLLKNMISLFIYVYSDSCIQLFVFCFTIFVFMYLSFFYDCIVCCDEICSMELGLLVLMKGEYPTDTDTSKNDVSIYGLTLAASMCLVQKCWKRFDSGTLGSCSDSVPSIPWYAALKAWSFFIAPHMLSM